MHARLSPKPHRFSYRVFSILIDIDQLEAAGNASSLFSTNKPGLISFHEKDHGNRDGSALRCFVDETLSQNGLQKADHIHLLCYPRVLGYTFNPISLYFCYGGDQGLTSIIYQVHNTFGQSHCYVGAVDASEENSVVKQEAEKQLYVSPFISMEGRYQFRVQAPANTVKLRILTHDSKGPLLSATFSGKKCGFSAKNLVKCLFGTLGLTWKVTAGIHFEALRLWLKGMKLVPRLAK